MRPDLDLEELLLMALLVFPPVLLFIASTIYIGKKRVLSSYLFFLGAIGVLVFMLLTILRDLFYVRLDPEVSDILTIIALIAYPSLAIGIFILVRNHVRLLIKKEGIDDIRGIDNEQKNQPRR